MCRSQQHHGKAFTLLADNKVLKDYCGPLIGFISYLIKSQKDKDLLQLPMTDDQMDMVQRFSRMLEKNKEDITLLHNLFFSFTAPPDDNLPIGQWMDALLHFIAISTICIDGSFKPVPMVTKDFAKWKYIIRSSTLHEILKAEEMEWCVIICGNYLPWMMTL